MISECTHRQERFSNRLSQFKYTIGLCPKNIIFDSCKLKNVTKSSHFLLQCHEILGQNVFSDKNEAKKNFL